MSFKEIIGQESAISFLKLAFRHNRIAHAYIFVGPDGVGKKKTALNFAKLFICQGPKTDEPCEQCPSCLKVESFNHPDVQWVSPQGQFIRIDMIREASRRLNLKGFESERKVLIICDAHCLNEESSNALLKTLEEPTPNTVIILLTNSLKSILPTIASRCQRVVFSSLNEEVLVSVLVRQFKIGKEMALYLARFSRGSLGLALQYHRDELFVKKNRIIDAAANHRYSLDKFMELDSGDRTERGTRINEMLDILASWYRDLFLAKISKDPHPLINYDRKKDIMQTASRFSLSEIENCISAIAEAETEIAHNINVRICLARLKSVLWK